MKSKRARPLVNPEHVTVRLRTAPRIASMLAALLVTACDGSASPSGTGSGGSGGAGGSSSSGAGGDPADAAPFSKLPPYDVLGVEWEYRYYFFDAAEYHTNHCRVVDTFTWPDDTPGSKVTCTWDSTQDAYIWEYAFYPDRIELRDTKYETIDPPITAYRVPVHVGDTWEESWNQDSFGWITEHYTAVGEETVDVEHGSVHTVKLEHFTENDGQTTEVLEVWWSDGLGRVKLWNSGQEAELLWFEEP